LVNDSSTFLPWVSYIISKLRPSSKIGVAVRDGSVTLGYRLGQGQPIEQPVYFSWTRPKFGGRRPWFLCPRCIRRVALLYLRGERWACRICCDLAYQSELECKGRRGQWRARKIHQKHEAAVAKSWSGFWGSRFARRLGLE
jgi:hypothetical protein